MQLFVDAIAAELERPRPLPRQTADHVASHYDVSRDGIGAFLAERLPALEDYEVDLVLSPVFTPSLQDQARFSELLDRETLPAASWPELVKALAARPTTAHLTTEDGAAHRVGLRDVVIERFVTRLHLDYALPERSQRLLNSLPPAADRAELKAIARRPVWREGRRADILQRFLVATTSGDDYRLGDVVHLLQLAETYQPKDAKELLGRIPAWQEVLKREIAVASSPKPFFSDRIQEMHGGGRDHRSANNAFVAAKKDALSFLARLESVLARD